MTVDVAGPLNTLLTVWLTAALTAWVLVALAAGWLADEKGPLPDPLVSDRPRLRPVRGGASGLRSPGSIWSVPAM